MAVVLLSIFQFCYWTLQLFGPVFCRVFAFFWLVILLIFLAFCLSIFQHFNRIIWSCFAVLLSSFSSVLLFDFLQRFVRLCSWILQYCLFLGWTCHKGYWPEYKQKTVHKCLYEHECWKSCCWRKETERVSWISIYIYNFIVSFCEQKRVCQPVTQTLIVVWWI